MGKEKSYYELKAVTRSTEMIGGVEHPVEKTDRAEFRPKAPIEKVYEYALEQFGQYGFDKITITRHEVD